MFVNDYTGALLPYNEDGINDGFGDHDGRMDHMMKFEKKGIRVNFNAIKEYLSMVLNFIKGTCVFVIKTRQQLG